MGGVRRPILFTEKSQVLYKDIPLPASRTESCHPPPPTD